MQRENQDKLKLFMSKSTQILCLAGTLCTELIFKHQVTNLGNKASTQVLALKKGSSIEEMASWVLSQAAPSFALVGFSHGAIVAMEIMRQAPERVSKLCLISANPRAASEQQLKLWVSWQEALNEGGFAEIIEAFNKNTYSDDQAIKSTITRMAVDIGSEVFKKQLQSLASRIDSRPFLSKVNCPTLLLVGQHDKVTPPEFHFEIQAYIANAELRVIDECGHYLPLEQAEKLTSILQAWLLN